VSTPREPQTPAEYWARKADSKGYGPVCAALSARFGTTFEVTMTGGNNWAIVALLAGYEAVITEAGDWVGDLTPIGEQGHGYGISFCPIVNGETGDCEVWVEDETATVGELPALVESGIAKLVAGKRKP
jgi:hypothetical protein